jgi:hypothetical protein
MYIVITKRHDPIRRKVTNEMKIIPTPELLYCILLCTVQKEMAILFGTRLCDAQFLEPRFWFLHEMGWRVYILGFKSLHHIVVIDA